jgi:uncharacterized membrane protein YgcG
MKTVIMSREKEVGRVRRALERLHSLRLQMMLIVALTAATGFLSSVLLLSGGVHSMPLRYPLAVLAAYLMFLFFLWCWLKLRWEDFVDVPDVSGMQGSVSDRSLPWEGGGGHSGGGGASGSWDGAGDRAISSLEQHGFAEGGGSSGSSDMLPDVGDAVSSSLDAEELVVVIIALIALAAAIAAAFWIVWIAPTLFAELTLDAALATGLYKRLKKIEGDHWLRTAIRRTIWPFVGVALLFTAAGSAMHAYAPDAKSIGQVIKQMKAD